MTSHLIPDKWHWFKEDRFGMFIHWGPYSLYGRGEQVLVREHMDMRAYEKRACSWDPQHYHPEEWAMAARQAGMRYAVLTSRHHDGFCLWNTKTTDYSAAAQAAGRDLVAEYIQAFRAAGLRVGLYYSLLDWRFPAYWEGPQRNPQGWAAFRSYVHAQVRELMSNYGKIDVLWFDGAWPYHALDWRSPELLEMIRDLQPEILINNRLGILPDEGDPKAPNEKGGVIAESRSLGDFGTPERHITPEAGRLWESCQVSTWRWWGYAEGERWRSSAYLLDVLTECASKGGNLLLNVGPMPDGRLPAPFMARLQDIGLWMKTHGEAIYGSETGEVCEFSTFGRQTVVGNNLYLIIRFWDGNPSLRLARLKTRVKQVTLLTTNAELVFEQNGHEVLIHGLPPERPSALFPVIRLECEEKPESIEWSHGFPWEKGIETYIEWARSRGEDGSAFH